MADSIDCSRNGSGCSTIGDRKPIPLRGQHTSNMAIPSPTRWPTVTTKRECIGIPDKNSIYSLPQMRNPVRIAVAALVAFILLASGLLVLYRTHSQRVKTSRYESMDGWE